MIMPDFVALCDGVEGTRASRHDRNRRDRVHGRGDRPGSLSPKLSNSTPVEREGGRFAAAHERQRLNVPVIQQFIDSSPDFQLKFVVSAEGDLDEIEPSWPG